MRFVTPGKLALAIAIVAAIVAAAWLRSFPTPPPWTASEIALLESLSIEALPPLQPDPSNAVGDNPLAAEFGRQLFFDSRLSANGGVSCATCHQAERRFTDGLQKAVAIRTTDRHTPSIVGMAYSPWQYWDGRRDSQWSQALAPIEDANEHGIDRAELVRIVRQDDNYSRTYAALFGPFPSVNRDPEVRAMQLNREFSNIGKAIAAFERTVMPTPSRFDAYVSAVVDGDPSAQQRLFSDDEVLGLRLFIGEANCLQCHNGPLFTNHEFHNTGVISFPGDVPDKGRVAGVQEVLVNEFNCRSQYSDDPSHQCPELDFVRTGVDLIGAFKTPSLRNLENTEPYMHKGQLATLLDVLRHYNDAPDAMIGHNEAEPLGLSNRELSRIEAFLGTLAAPVTGLHSGGNEAASEIETISAL